MKKILLIILGLFLLVGNAWSFGFGFGIGYSRGGGGSSFEYENIYVDTAEELLAAITAIKNSDAKAGIIYAMPGTYTFTETIIIDYPINIIGSGPEITNFIYNHNGIGIEVKNGDTWQATTAYSAGDTVIAATANPNGTRFRCTTAGTSAGSEPSWNHTVGADTTDGTVTWETDQFISWGLSGFTQIVSATATGNGIDVFGANNGRLHNILSEDGNANIWAYNFDACNVIDIEFIGGAIDSNGLKFELTNPTLFPYNFGDSSIRKFDINLESNNTVGMKFIGPSNSTKTVNNIKVDQFEIVGSGGVTDFQIGIWVENAGRLTFDHGDIEVINYGVLEISETDSGQASQDNSFQRIHFIPSGSQTEAVGYMRGAPLVSEHSTGTGTFVIRSGWVDALGFANDDALRFGMNDYGMYSRTVDNPGIAADTPSAGLTTITTTAFLNVTMPLDRIPVISPGAAFPVRTSMWGSKSLGRGIMLPGPNPMITFYPSSSSDSVSFDEMHLKMQTSGIVDLLRDRTGTSSSPSDGTIRFELNSGATREAANTQLLYPAAAGEVLRLGTAGKQTVRYSEVQAKSTTYTATQIDEVFILTAAAGWSLTLPAVADSEGKHYWFKKTDNNGNIITIDGADSETIDGATTYTGLDAQYTHLHIFCDGSVWHILGSN